MFVACLLGVFSLSDPDLFHSDHFFYWFSFSTCGSGSCVILKGRVSINACVCVCVRARARVRACVRTCVCVCTCVCTCVCACVCTRSCVGAVY